MSPRPREGARIRRGVHRAARACARWTALLAVVAGGAAAQGSHRALTPQCLSWDIAAGEALARRLAAGVADLRLVSDAVFRLRRARRNCEYGAAHLACEDYAAVRHGEPGTRLRVDTDAPCDSLRVAPLPGDAGAQRAGR